MKKTIVLLVLLCIGFASCDGRKSHNGSLSDSIEMFKKTVKIEMSSYTPETYVEQKVDTLLSNGFRVHIKTYSDMETNVVYSKIKDTINYKTHYRNYKFDIRVEKNGKVVYNETFNKSRANKILGFGDNFVTDSPLYNFNTLAVLKSIQINDEPSLKNDVLIDIIYAIPETNRYSLHTLFIMENGKSNMVIVETK